MTSAPNTNELWKLQLLEVALEGWVLAPYQAVALLHVFDSELGQDERVAAAVLCYARLAQPLDMWEEVLPMALKPLQQRLFKDRWGPRQAGGCRTVNLQLLGKHAVIIGTSGNTQGGLPGFRYMVLLSPVHTPPCTGLHSTTFLLVIHA